MINPGKDPKGYYVTLGVTEDASIDDVKSAFRAKAKRLHPDHNTSPIAAKQFHRVHEAYETLADPVKRATYDRGWRTVSGGSQSAKPESKPQPKPEPPKHEAPKAEPPKPEPPRPEKNTKPPADARRSSATDQPATCQCGNVTAQPRYIIFDMVWGRVTSLHRRNVSGVYCRTCADKAAIKASYFTWLAGWWSWPDGPRETVKALLSNMRGGRKPAERNARLLINQSRAFRTKGDMQLARACAEQALQFATNSGLRREVDSLLLSLSSFPAREIKDRWANPGLAPFIQLAPIGAVVGALSIAATLSAPMSLTDYAKSWFPDKAPAITAPSPVGTPVGTPVRSGRIYAVMAPALALKTGPGEAYRVNTLLKKGTVVLVTEEDPTGHWVRILMTDGTTGFVETKGLTPDVNVDALNTLGAFGAEKNAIPQTDERP